MKRSWLIGSVLIMCSMSGLALADSLSRPGGGGGGHGIIGG